MTLRTKTNLLILGTFLTLVLALHFTVRQVLLSGYTGLEDQYAISETQHILTLLDKNLATCQTTLSETVTAHRARGYMLGEHPDYFHSTFTNAKMMGRKVHLALFVKPDGRLVEGKMVDPASGQPQQLPSELATHYAPGSPLLQPLTSGQLVSGYLRLGDSLYYVAALPIDAVDSTTPIGCMIVGRKLTIATLQLMRDWNANPVSLKLLGPAENQAAAQTFPPTPDNAPSIMTLRLNTQLIAGKALLRDLYGQPVAELSVTNPRAIYAHGRALLERFTRFILLIGLLFSAGSAYVFRKMYLNRLDHLKTELGRLRTHGDLLSPIAMPGNDEFSSVTDSVNAMLNSLRQSQKSLHRSDERMRLSLAGSHVCLWDWDVASSQVDFAHHWSEILGYAPGEVDGSLEALKNYVHPDDLPRASSAVEEHFAGRSANFEVELRLHSKAGDWHWFLLRGKVIRRGPTGSPMRAVGMLLDVTDRRLVQEELIRLNDSLESRVSARTLDLALANENLIKEVAERQRAEEALREASHRKDEFLAMLAHELRNPLAPIRNAVQVLHMAGDDEAMKRRQWVIIDRQVAHMARLLDDLLDVGRITQGKIRLQSEAFDLRHAIDRAIEGVQGQANEHGHSLIYQRPAAAYWVDGDSTRLEQVFINLLNNAIKYTEGQGTIQVLIGCEGAPDSEARNAVIRVRDTGIGIAPEVLPHIFGLFVQGDRSLDRTQGGLGIGLTLVERLVQMHGGSVQASSEGPGRGSEFTIRLPLLADELAQELNASAGDLHAYEYEATAEPAAALDERKVLVVDDNADMARSMSELLELWGYMVRVAFDGPSAIDVAMAYTPDIVLLDIGLPGMNGYEVAKALRESPAFASTLFIALTGYSQEEDRQQAMAAGFDKFCTKPVELDALRRILNGADMVDADNLV